MIKIYEGGRTGWASIIWAFSFLEIQLVFFFCILI